MATATSVDMVLIAEDATFKLRVQALVYQFCIVTVGGGGTTELALANHVARKNYASQVLNNPNTFMNDFVLACAQNQILANDVITSGNGGVNFTPSTAQTTVAAAVTTSTPLTTGATDTDIANAIAAAFNTLANA